MTRTVSRVQSSLSVKGLCPAWVDTHKAHSPGHNGLYLGLYLEPLGKGQGQTKSRRFLHQNNLMCIVQGCVPMFWAFLPNFTCGLVPKFDKGVPTLRKRAE